MINQLFQDKAIDLNEENSVKNVFNRVANNNYTYVFISLKITFSKKFKKCILDK